MHINNAKIIIYLFTMTKLSVNINKIATLRNARGGNNPDVVKVALDCEKFGAEGITVHPRPDERHIRRSDVYDLRPLLSTEFNIEGYPSKEFIGADGYVWRSRNPYIHFRGYGH